MKIGELENGKITINLYDLFSDMSEEELKELADVYCWQDPSYKALIKNLQTEYAGTNFNPSLYAIRKAIITLPEEDMPHNYSKTFVVGTIADTVHSIISENVTLKIELQRMHKLRPRVYDYVKNKYGDNVAYDIHSHLIDFEMKGIEGKYAHAVAYEDHTKHDNGPALDKLVSKWFEELYERFTAIAPDKPDAG